MVETGPEPRPRSAKSAQATRKAVPSPRRCWVLLAAAATLVSLFASAPLACCVEPFCDEEGGC